MIFYSPWACDRLMDTIVWLPMAKVLQHIRQTQSLAYGRPEYTHTFRYWCHFYMKYACVPSATALLCASHHRTLAPFLLWEPVTLALTPLRMHLHPRSHVWARMSDLPREIFLARTPLLRIIENRRNCFCSLHYGDFNSPHCYSSSRHLKLAARDPCSCCQHWFQWPKIYGSLTTVLFLVWEIAHPTQPAFLQLAIG